MHTTNYYKTFIEIAEDSPTTTGEAPPVKAAPSVANLQFDMLSGAPYRYTSDELLFGVFAKRQGFAKSALKVEREFFFSKGQPCLRASPLTKRYGWGIHSDSDGKVAIVAAGSTDYERIANDDAVTKVKAMRSKRA